MFNNRREAISLMDGNAAVRIICFECCDSILTFLNWTQHNADVRRFILFTEKITAKFPALFISHFKNGLYWSATHRQIKILIKSTYIWYANGGLAKFDLHGNYFIYKVCAISSF